MVIELIKYILPGFIQYHPILGRNFLSLGLARLRAVLALAEVKPRLMCAGRLDSHLSLVGLVLGLWPVCLGFTTSMQKSACIAISAVLFVLRVSPGDEGDC